MKRYVILFRGLNVGGKSTVSMTELKVCLEELGLKNVKTYINSGNALVSSDKTKQKLASEIEEMLPKKFHLENNLSKVLVLSHDDLKAVIGKAPKGFGTEPAKYHSDVIFLIGITPDEAMPVFAPREGVDTIWPGSGVIYSQRLSALRTKSRLSKIVGTPAYKNMTIRTWGTATKLLSLLEDMNTA